MPARSLIRRLPKIDLHLHLEGSVPRATLEALAARHRLEVPPLRRFDGFAGFLRAFGKVCELLVDEDDFQRAAGALFERSRRLGVAHLEVLFSPQVFLRRGIAPGAMMRGLLRARQRAMRHEGFSAIYIMDGVRQWGGEWFDQTVRILAPWAGRGLSGVGIGGDERAAPARDFARAFRRARDLGLGATVHAGEAAGPASVREAIAALGVSRVGHGVRAAEDPSLVKALADSGTTLEICPTSNVATGAAASWGSHPLRRLFEAGVPITINSDDGTFFGTDVAVELERASRILGFGLRELGQANAAAARAAFLPASARRRLEARIVRAWTAARGPTT